MFWLFAFVIFIVLFFYYDRRRLNYWSRKGVKQSNPLPLVGDNIQPTFRRIPFCDLVKTIYDRFDGVRYVGCYQFYQPVLMLKDPKLLKQICVKDFEHFLDHRPFIKEDADPLWAKNLFALRGQKWKEMRSTLSPSFTGSKMRQMFVLMHDCAKGFAGYFAEKPEALIEIELKDAFTRYTNDIIASTAFGIHCDSMNDRENEFYKNGKIVTDFTKFTKSIKFVLVLLFPKLAQFIDAPLFDKEPSDFFRGIMKNSLKIREESKIERPDLLNLLMQARKGSHNDEDGSNLEETNFAAVEEHLKPKVVHKAKLDMSLDDMTSQALLFFIAGFETVATVMCMVAYELAVNPDIQARLIEELDEFRSSGEKFSYESLAKLPYLDMVLSETLRKWPPSTATDRTCNKAYKIEPELAGEKPLQLDVDDVIWIPIWAIHRDENFWENPEKFDPERFSAENKHKIEPYTYIPFGVGPRNCIGSRFGITEVKVVFYELLASFEIVPTKKSTIPFVQDNNNFNVAAANGFWFGLKKRKNL